MRVGAVDCGTNSVRLLVADVDGAVKHDVLREMRVVRLGEGVDRTGELSEQALERTRRALADYAATCAELAVEQIRMVATSATRDARNRDQFRSMVREVLGVEPEVISGDEEAALSFDGATRGLDPADGPFLVVDIGGGSTELVLGTTAVEAALSVDIGCVRLTERHLVGDPPRAGEVAAAEADIDAALALVREVVPVERARTTVGLAGSVTTVAALALELPAYDPDRIHLSRIPAAQVAAVTARLLAQTREQRAALPVMHPGRVDVIGAGALVLSTVVDRLGLAEVLVSEADILDGIAWSVPQVAATRPAAVQQPVR
ncbi:MAG: Exopolyphosphatase [uncultured Frankineae bacterium]|uniref:Exopolyphosphatase n=1 Tax=uncultured Frankineae bacterium TaxID=437475 RepID=A0A6J4LJM4_9ACTN|nr:MAG: Exopolyphosphatase [uncultured Frankineae bacterium]